MQYHIWEDPAIEGIRRRPMHSPLSAYESVRQAAAGDRQASAWVRLLDGKWAFKLYGGPDAVPEDFKDPDLDDSGWDKIDVPGNWQTQGHDIPIYTNTHIPFEITKEDRDFAVTPGKNDPRVNSFHFHADLKTGRVPRANPTGIYRTKFLLTEGWVCRQVRLNFEGVESAFTVYVNGEEVGYSRDSKLSAEFDITPYIHMGENTLVLRVLRYSAATYVEDQDYWYLSGIYRSVVLYAKPRFCIEDMHVMPLVNDDLESGTLHALCWVTETDNYAKARVRMTVLNAEGHVAAMPIEDEIGRFTEDSINTSGFDKRYRAARFEVNMTNLNLWSAEDPYRYTVVFTLFDGLGREVDYESVKIGFRRLETDADGVLRLNGGRLILRGVNRHEFRAETGRAVTREWMRKEIIAMKRLNFNAVRTSHYPDDPAWYDLCDELGIYLVDETNLETHGIRGRLSGDPEWAPTYMQRITRMIMRDKNHPSILFWSLGNESDVGPNHFAMAAWARAFDPTRMVHYCYAKEGPGVSDLACYGYLHPDTLVEVLKDKNEKRPVLLTEYAFASGNSTGDLDRYWEIVDMFPRFAGGFIWDWQDKPLVAHTEDGTKFYGYAGAFGESIQEPTRNFCVCGLVSPKLEPHPGAYEAAVCMAPVTLEATGIMSGRFRLINKYLTSDLADMEVRWSITEDGVAVSEGSMPLPGIPAGSSVRMQIPYELPKAEPGREYFVNLEICQSLATAWSPEGHRVWWGQFPMTMVPLSAIRRPEDENVLPIPTLKEEETLWKVSGSGFSMVFDKYTGLMEEWISGGRALCVEGAREMYWRTPTSVDLGDHGPCMAMIWKKGGYDAMERSLLRQSARISGNSVVLEMWVRLGHEEKRDAISSFMRYIISPDGSLTVENHVEIAEDMPPIPRIGVMMALPGSFSNLTYFGRGPLENYPDRKKSTRIGRFNSTVTKEHVPYIKPSENGGHEDTRWLTLLDKEGYGLKVSSLNKPLHFSVHDYTPFDAMVDYDHEILRRDEVYLILDTAHSGVGGDDGWSANLHEEFRVKPGTYRYGFVLEPVK